MQQSGMKCHVNPCLLVSILVLYTNSALHVRGHNTVWHQGKHTLPQISPVCKVTHPLMHNCPQTHIMWGQSRAGPVVCHSEAIRGKPEQVRPCQSRAERWTGLMRLHTAPREMNITLKTYKDLHALILLESP